MKTAKKSNPQPFFSPKSRKWRKKSIARQHLHVPRSCRRRLASLQQLSLKQNDLEWPTLLPGCGTQHPHRALGGTCVLLAAAPTTPPCFRHWRRSSSLHFGHIQRKNYFIISEYRSGCGRSGIPFSREEFGTSSLSQRLPALPAPSRREPLTRPQALRFSRKLYRYAIGPISEDDFPRPREDVATGDKKGNLSP